MKHGSLFSGIGGFDLASELVGWDNLFQVEIDSYCQKVLRKNFPNVKLYGDIKEFKGTDWRGTVDIISGGFPCQPFSVAGKRRGQKDNRYLWDEMLRVIREITPSFIVGENVAGLISMEGGGTLDRILSDLEDEGYATEQFIIPACAIGAWHRRDRIWIVAYDKCMGWKKRSGISLGQEEQESEGQELNHICEEVSSNSNSNGWEYRGTLGGGRQDSLDWEQYSKESDKVREEWKCEFGEISDNVSNPNCKHKQEQFGGNKLGEMLEEEAFRWSDPKSGRQWISEPRVGRVAHGIPNRVDRLKGLGNAIVPQVAYEIFTVINNLIYGGEQK
jgi:DNA (cytosine-5)-methyltransferase 1